MSTPSNREQALQRAGRRCERCGWCESLTIHHVRPRSAGGTNDVANLAVLCGQCHIDWHRYEREWVKLLCSRQFRRWVKQVG